MFRSSFRAAVVALVLVLAGCGGSPEPVTITVTVTATVAPPTPKAPPTFTATGTIDVDTVGFGNPGRSCESDSGYDDISEGAQVAVSDASGEVLAVGRLEAGTASDVVTCQYAFTVSDIPEGESLYQIEVAHRGTLSYSQSELETGVSLTLQ